MLALIVFSASKYSVCSSTWDFQQPIRFRMRLKPKKFYLLNLLRREVWIPINMQLEYPSNRLYISLYIYFLYIKNIKNYFGIKRIVESSKTWVGKMMTVITSWVRKTIMKRFSKVGGSCGLYTRESESATVVLLIYLIIYIYIEPLP